MDGRDGAVAMVVGSTLTVIWRREPSVRSQKINSNESSSLVSS